MAWVRGNTLRIVYLVGRNGVWSLVLAVLLAGHPALAVEHASEDDEQSLDAQNQATAPDKRVLDRARELIDGNQAKQAYDLLAPREYDWSGDPEYDYLLGTAALASGRADEAVMPLERAIADDPDNAATRLALARAYFHTGDHEIARTELGYLGRQDFPHDGYADIYGPTTVDRRDAGPRRTRFRYYVAMDTGYDSNANAGTDKNAFLGVALNSNNVEKDSAYVAVSNGGILNVPLSQKWDYDLRFNFANRRNLSATFANTDRIGLNNEFLWRSDITRLKFGVGLHTAYLDSRAPYDGDHVQSGLTLDFGARWLLGDNRAWQIGTDVVAATARHTSRIRVFDVDQYLAAFAMDYLGRGQRPSFGFAVFVGDAHARQSGSPYGRNQYGARYTMSWPVGYPNEMFYHFGVSRSNYDGQFFGRHRNDMQYSTGLSSVIYVFPSRNWSLVPHLTYIQNQSDVSLFEYKRTEIGLAFRWVSDWW